MIASLFVNNDRYELSFSRGKFYREEFSKNRLVVLPEFFKPAAFSILQAEVGRLAENKKRRDLLMPGSENTVRKMSTLSGLAIKKESGIIPSLYFDKELRNFLSGIVDEEICSVPDDVENYVCNFLHLRGDTHGAHIDTYPFAFNIMVQAPPRDGGGVLEIAQNSAGTGNLENPGMVKSEYIPAGSCYLLRTDKVIHRVSPLTEESARTIINFAYAGKHSVKSRSYSSGILYD